VTDRHPTSTAALERALAAVEAHEPRVRAWVTIDRDGAREAAQVLDAGPDRPLRGVVLGVKDVLDTAALPTACGSPIYAGFRPRADAAAVALLRDAGALCLGKTVTAELALVTPGPTTNPHRATHTPGGSSMGSAAALATGMADLALGTQTAGSVIRPAAFCGVFGFKPTFDAVPTAGMKEISRSLDTIGWFARDASVLAAAHGVLTGEAVSVDGPPPPRIALVRTRHWDRADADAQTAVLEAARAARGAGAVLQDRDLPPSYRDLDRAQGVVMTYEAAQALAWERAAHRDLLSPALRDLLDGADHLAHDDHAAALAVAAEARRDTDAVFGDADVLLTPAVVGEAPFGLERTGDPRFARVWTLLGWPTLSVPGVTGSSGLPVGVQLVGRAHDDARLLRAGAWLADAIAARTSR
jgi:Asp-tRNA(Asn)/Glu-tRNA(Gln) amidotransferase A subunit family amidase